MKKKTVFVFWSGGIDSTFLLQTLLRDPQYENVVTGYVAIDNHETKVEAELAAMARMQPILDELGPLVPLGIVMRVSFYKTNRNLAMKQMPIWLLAAIEAIHLEVDEIALGYLASDDAFAHIEHLQSIYTAYQPLMFRERPPLTFPLLRLQKQQVIDQLDPRLRALCVHCENPVRDDSGALVPCKTCRICKKWTWG
jgi:7-cyano-7-deazaguanine synthase in queuosine biosynthesis